MFTLEESFAALEWGRGQVAFPRQGFHFSYLPEFNQFKFLQLGKTKHVTQNFRDLSGEPQAPGSFSETGATSHTAGLPSRPHWPAWRSKLANDLDQKWWVQGVRRDLWLGQKPKKNHQLTFWVSGRKSSTVTVWQCWTSDRSDLARCTDRALLTVVLSCCLKSFQLSTTMEHASPRSGRQPLIFSSDQFYIVKSGWFRPSPPKINRATGFRNHSSSCILETTNSAWNGHWLDIATNSWGSDDSLLDKWVCKHLCGSSKV